MRSHKPTKGTYNLLTVHHGVMVIQWLGVNQQVRVEWASSFPNRTCRSVRIQADMISCKV
jgi:hypothetical protein